MTRIARMVAGAAVCLALYAGSSTAEGSAIPVNLVIQAEPASGELPLQVSFSATADDLSEGEVYTWIWDFGDGGTLGTGPSVVHIYKQAGRFPVRCELVLPSNETLVAATTVEVIAASYEVVILDFGDDREAVRQAFGGLPDISLPVIMRSKRAETLVVLTEVDATVAEDAVDLLRAAGATAEQVVSASAMGAWADVLSSGDPDADDAGQPGGDDDPAEGSGEGEPTIERGYLSVQFDASRGRGPKAEVYEIRYVARPGERADIPNHRALGDVPLQEHPMTPGTREVGIECDRWATRPVEIEFTPGMHVRLTVDKATGEVTVERDVPLGE